MPLAILDVKTAWVEHDNQALMSYLYVDALDSFIRPSDDLPNILEKNMSFQKFIRPDGELIYIPHEFLNTIGLPFNIIELYMRLSETQTLFIRDARISAHNERKSRVRLSDKLNSIRRMGLFDILHQWWRGFPDEKFRP